MEENARAEFRVNRRQRSATPGLLDQYEVVLKPGPRVLRRATLSEFGDSATREVRRRELVLSSWDVRQGEVGAEHDKRQWRCKDDEITALQAFLAEHRQDAGSYRLTPSDGVVVTDAEPAVLDLTRRLGPVLGLDLDWTPVAVFRVVAGRTSVWHVVI